MTFDPTLTLGNVLTLIGLLGGALTFWVGMVRRLDRIEWKMDMLWKWYQHEHGINGDHGPEDRPRR